MSIRIPVAEFQKLEKVKRVEMLNECTVEAATAIGKPEKIECFMVDGADVLLPKYFAENQQLTVERTYEPLSCDDTTFQLREYQRVVEREVDAVMSTYQSILLSLHCGWGKSYFAILYALKLKLRTLVTVYRVSHLEQWRQSILTVNKKLRVQVLENKTAREDADFYLILGENLAHRPCDEFASVGTFIVDECHMFCTPSMSKSFMRVQPKYCLALSATPFRTDQLDQILQLHFGYAMVKRKLYRFFNVYQLKTKFKPSVQETARGQLDWSHVIDSQAGNAQRNLMIVRLCEFFANRTIMILTKRVDLQGQMLYDALKSRGQSVDLFVRTRQTYDRDARILISTFSKAGVGFDNPKLDMLIVAGDVEEMFEQYLGRVFRRMDTVPIIVDIVDDFHVFNKHFNTRMITYLNSGGQIKPFQKHFPECDVGL
jgi:superfamily II DNA or RNA helicase